jgi:hypothetical protein
VQFISTRKARLKLWSGWQELNLRGHAPKACGWPLPYTRTLVARHGIEPCPLALQTSTLPSSSRAKLGGRCETRTRIARLQAVGNPLIRTAHWGEMRESNSRDWSHNPVPKPFGQSRHKNIWSWSSESNTRRRGTSSLHFHCARPANSGAGTQPRTAVGRLPYACSSR